MTHEAIANKAAVATVRPINPLVTVVESVYHQVPGEQPTQPVESRYSSELATDEQPFIRKFKVGSEWKALETGWLNDCSMLVLKNEAPHWTVQPTDEERLEAALKVVEMGCGGKALAELPPGESLRFRPADICSLRVRCIAGAANCVLCLFPK